MHLHKSRNVTYLGRAAKVWTLTKTANATGERVQFVRWVEQATSENGGHAPGTVVASHMTGDGRYRDKFTKHAEAVFTGPDATAEASDWALQRLTAEDPIATAMAAQFRTEQVAFAARMTRTDCTPSSGC